MISSFDAWASVYDSIYSYVTEDIPFFVDRALESGGPVLELGCGTGRVAIPIAQAGAEVFGLDSSPAMLEVARRKSRTLTPPATGLTLVEADMRHFSLERRFPLVIIPFRGFLSLMTVEDQASTLRRIKLHLAPGGRLILSIFVPDPDMLTQDGDVAYYLRDVTDPHTSQKFVLWHQSSFDNYSQVISTRLIVERLDSDGTVRERFHRDFQLRYIHRWEMHHLLRASGFRVVELYGDFDHSPFDETSTEMVWVAEVDA